MTTATDVQAQAAAAPDPGARVWDPLVRVTHWGVAAAIVANGLITEEGSAWHVWVGYAAGALLVLRLLWGLVGPAEARFSAFPPSPRRAFAHLRDIATGRKRRERSHNGLGALMAYALWATLAVVVGTGVAMTGPPTASTFQAGPASIGGEGAERHEEAGEDDDHEAYEAEGAETGEGGGEVIEEVHEAAANLLFVLAALHLAGVAFETRRMGPAVVRSMLGGTRRRTQPE